MARTINLYLPKLSCASPAPQGKVDGVNVCEFQNMDNRGDLSHITQAYWKLSVFNYGPFIRIYKSKQSGDKSHRQK